jgi:protein TonB
MKRRPRVRIVISLAGLRSRLARFMTGSVAVHGLLLAAVLIVPATRHKAPPIEDSMVVALAGPIAAAPPARAASAAPQAAKPEPAPPPPPKEAQAVRELPKPKPKEKDKPVKPKPEPAKTDEPETPAPPATKPAAGAGTQTGAPAGAPAGPAAGAVTATIGGGDSSLGWYGAAVKAALEAVWQKPYLEDSEGTVSVVITFDIAKDGTTRNIRILAPSGIPSLDRSAQRAVIEASPLPGIPPTWTEPLLPVTMRFDLSPEAR